MKKSSKLSNKINKWPERANNKSIKNSKKYCPKLLIMNLNCHRVKVPMKN